MEAIQTISNLPGELQNQIFENLEPFSVLTLRQVNQYFRQILPCSNATYLLSPQYLHDIETSSWHPLRSQFACFLCLRTRPEVCFSAKRTHGKYGKNGAGWDKRCCMDCLITHESVTPNPKLKMHNGAYRILCPRCRTLQVEWCTQCQLCRGCATTSDVEWNSTSICRKIHDRCYLWYRDGDPGRLSFQLDPEMSSDCLFPWEYNSPVLWKTDDGSYFLFDISLDVFFSGPPIYRRRKGLDGGWVFYPVAPVKDVFEWVDGSGMLGELDGFDDPDASTCTL